MTTDSNLSPFEHFIDTFRYNSKRHKDIDTVLLSRSKNQWAAYVLVVISLYTSFSHFHCRDKLNTAKLGRARSSALPGLILPILANFTKG